MRPTKHESGVGLIEVLIALFIASIACLAGAVMQMDSLQNNHESLFRSQAVRLAQSMAESMHANPDGVASGAYNDIDTDDELVSSGCLTSGCTPAQTATEDALLWKNTLSPTDGSLPALPPMSNGDPARGTVAINVDGGHTISMQWEVVVDGEMTEQTHSIDVWL